ncbi:helix-turn-helix domain-containing protein [Sphingosinicella microcystinivorans]|uniref:DNA-binding XRE family transcriptional regulator n=1 Tax=Sphingosinicella microcystinivorans TaxID=335406 RepID=A0AAD1D7E6_SPHMI|nr:helix-turn-helix transcriptional regulator [Sphingosinicella microcystinivorans]RKS92235.1 DNA-binding XRE family transcriptional regulator [Sphingosinicella microcystinivorans]BBE35257.1 hypothetical protein SmB9_29150 [Sphingosinicella microcystinivorans]
MARDRAGMIVKKAALQGALPIAPGKRLRFGRRMSVDYFRQRKIFKRPQSRVMTGVRIILARNLKALREVRDVSQEKLAAVAGIDRSYISDLENEKYGLSIDKLENLAEALGVAAWEMLHPETAANIRSTPPAD